MPPNLFRLRSVFATMIALLVFVSAVTWWYGRFVLDANREIIVQQSLCAQVDRIIFLMTEAETGQRGYVLTGEESYLDPYRLAISSIHDEVGLLRQHPYSDEVDPARVAELSRLVEAKLAQLEKNIQVRRTGSSAEAIAMVRSGVGKAAMDQFRAVALDLRGEEQNRLDDLRQQANQRTVWRTTIILATTLIELAFCLWAYRRIVRSMARAAEAAAETRRQKDLLAVTLSSIGDAVIVTDTQARITFMNQVAEKLTGWPFADARNRPISDIFRIINEATRKTVDNPVEKVLRAGKIIGLANHTLLLRRDNSEIPIDDSGAPIRDEAGNIYGVVLVFRDFSDHKAAERALLAAKAEAEAANRAKDQFLATLSHELRTPLTPVVATLNIWETSDSVPAELKSDVQMIRRNVDLEVRLIDDMLDLTRIARGKFSLNLEAVDFHAILRSTLDIVRPDLDAKKLHVTLETRAARHVIRGDPARRLQQILWNLLKNAVKFTPEGGAIDVETDDDPDGRIRLRVRDTGIGMAGDILARIFRPFEQGAADTNRRFGGLGLGLAISKALVDTQGGTIAAESAGDGKGSTFTVCFPVVADEVRQTPTRSAPADSGAAARRLHILLVEDHPDTARAMERILKSLGHQVSLALSVQEAAGQLSRQAFDLLVSDIGLPDGTGVDVLRYAQTLRRIPAVALTGFGMEDDIARSRQAGFAAHLTKPVNIQTLQAAIEAVAGNPAG